MHRDEDLALEGELPANELEQRVVASDVNADHRWLVMITGANQGGKSASRPSCAGSGSRS
jgi:hypothetical protein